MTAFVLGNGVSRTAVNLETLRQFGKLYGCNALYRTFRPDVLVATDRGMAREIEESGYAQHWPFYTRRPLPRSGAQIIDRPYYGFSSGPVAIALAAKDKHDPVVLLGFDLGPDSNGRFNNIYAGTENYKPQGSEPTFTGNWTRQITRLMKEFHKQTFIRIMGATSCPIAAFETVPNFQHMDILDFLASINNQKEIEWLRTKE